MILGTSRLRASRSLPFIFLLPFFLVLEARSQGFLKADGKKIVNEKGENVLLRGMGLGGWMLQEGYMMKVRGQGAAA